MTCQDVVRRLGSGLVAAVLGAAVVVTTAAPTWAAGTLDQSNPGPATDDIFIASSICNASCSNYFLGQTFTAGITGDLDTLELNLWLERLDPGDLVVKIQGTDSLANPGLPDDQDVLATQIVPQSTIPTTSSGVTTVTFTTPAPVQAGRTYAIVLTSTLGQIDIGNSDSWYRLGRTGDNYAGGGRCAYQGSTGAWTCYAGLDAVFATYVTPAPPGPPSAGVSAGSLSFGSQATGSATSAQTLTVTNSTAAGSQSLAVGSLSTTGAAPGDFVLSNDTCSNASVAAGNSCTVDIAFVPTATGARTATLQIPSNASSSPDQVALSGTGISSADVRVSMSGPASAARGTTVTYSITVTNNGPSSASNVVLRDSTSSGGRYAGVHSSQGTCQIAKGTVTCSLGTLASGGTAGSVVSIKITARAGSTVTNLASAASAATKTAPATPDPDTSNNWASITTSVTG